MPVITFFVGVGFGVFLTSLLAVRGREEEIDQTQSATLESVKYYLFSSNIDFETKKYVSHVLEQNILNYPRNTQDVNKEENK